MFKLLYLYFWYFKVWYLHISTILSQYLYCYWSLTFGYFCRSDYGPAARKYCTKLKVFYWTRPAVGVRVALQRESIIVLYTGTGRSCVTVIKPVQQFWQTASFTWFLVFHSHTAADLRAQSAVNVLKIWGSAQSPSETSVTESRTQRVHEGNIRVGLNVTSSLDFPSLILTSGFIHLSGCCSALCRLTLRAVCWCYGPTCDPAPVDSTVRCGLSQSAWVWLRAPPLPPTHTHTHSQGTETLVSQSHCDGTEPPLCL